MSNPKTELVLPKTSPDPGVANTSPEPVLSERGEAIASSNEETQVLGGSVTSGTAGILGKTSRPLLSDQLRQLDQLIAWFDQDDFDLDEALGKFDEGVKLTEQIEARLGKLENKITVLKQKFEASAEKNA